MKPTILYHCTARENLDSILEHGLEARDTSQHHYPDQAFSNHGVRAVYATTKAWGWWGCGGDGVCLMLDVTGLRREPDPVLTLNNRGNLWAWRVRGRVKPERIMAVLKKEEQ